LVGGDGTSCPNSAIYQGKTTLFKQFQTHFTDYAKTNRIKEKGLRKAILKPR